MKLQRKTSLLHKCLSDIFLQEKQELLDKNLATITQVILTKDLSLAKVYITFIIAHKEPSVLLAHLTKKQGFIRKCLMHKLGKVWYKLPNLVFYLDESLVHAAKIQEALKNIAHQP